MEFNKEFNEKLVKSNRRTITREPEITGIYYFVYKDKIGKHVEKFDMTRYISNPTIIEAVKWYKETLITFNNSLRPYQSKRTFVKVFVQKKEVYLENPAFGKNGINLKDIE